MKSKFPQVITRRQVLAALGLVGAGVLTKRVSAQDQPPVEPPVAEPPLPGTLGLLQGQMARLSVVHYSHGEAEGVSDPCIIFADVVGTDGKSLAQAMFQDLKDNEARFLDFIHPATKGKPGDTRLELLDVVRFTPGHEIGSSLQIIDLKSGETLFVQPTPCVFPDPALAPPNPVISQDPSNGQVVTRGFPLFGTVGLVRGQHLLLSIVHHQHAQGGADPCVIFGEVIDADGKVLASQKFEDLAEHQAVFVDFPHPGGTGPKRDTRLEVSVHVRHTPGHHIGGTIQVIDTSSGETLFATYPGIIGPD